MTINRWTVAPYCSRWLVITLLCPHLRASRRYQCNTNSINIHMCFIECKYERVNKMQLLSSFLCILIHILNDEGMSCPSSNEHYTHEGIMLRKTTDKNDVPSSFNIWIRMHKNEDTNCILLTHSYLHSIKHVWILTEFVLHWYLRIARRWGHERAITS